MFAYSFDAGHDSSIYTMKMLFKNFLKKIGITIPPKKFKHIIFEVISGNFQVIFV